MRHVGRDSGAARPGGAPSGAARSGDAPSGAARSGQRRTDEARAGEAPGDEGRTEVALPDRSPADGARGGAVRRVRVLAAGRVQGVGFRYTMREAAQRAAVTGWVRNRIDGSVEAEIEGTPERVDELLTWTSHGPPWAKVESVTVTEIHPVADTGFEIRGAGG